MDDKGTTGEFALDKDKSLGRMNQRDSNDLLQELRTHQIELELQNKELRATQKELLDSRDKYLDLYDSAPVGYISLNKSGLIVEANLTFASLLEQNRQSLLHKKLTFFIVPEHQDLLYHHFRKTQKDKLPQNTQLQLIRKNHSPIWVNISSSLVVGPSTHSTSRLIITKIDTIKKAEEALRESEERLRLVLDATSDGVFDRNIHTGSIYYGENWAKNLGYSQEEIKQKGITWGTLLHPDDEVKVLSAVQKHLEGQTESYKSEFRMRHKNGFWKWVQARGRVVQWDANGKPLRFVGVHTDISEQKKLEGKLRKSEQKFRTLAEISPAGIYLTNANGDCIYVNRCWKEMSGLTTEEALGQGWIKGVHPNDRKRVYDEWHKMVQSDGNFALEFRFVNPKGQVTWVYGLAKAMPEDQEGSAGYVGINTDISIQKQAEIELKISFSELEKLVHKKSFELQETNKELHKEIEVRARVEQELLQSEAKLEKEKCNLEEINNALCVLLKKVNEEKHKMEEQMLMNVNKLVQPFIEEIKKDRLTKRQSINVDFMESNLRKVTSPFLRNISSLGLKLSPREIKVAHLVKEGKTSKEIAADLKVSVETVYIHRKNIRKKCGISGKNQNLRSMLMSLEQQ